MPLILIAEIFATIILIVVAYIALMAWKAKNIVIKNSNELIKSKEFMQAMNNINEPDELIEAWQEGYLIALKTFLQKLYEELPNPLKQEERNLSILSRYLDTHFMQVIDLVNTLQVVKEFPAKFFLHEPDAEHEDYWIAITDMNTLKEWKPRDAETL